ncbi:hypothetical protein NPIL_623891 [Nephila pilipes]|uniref:Uncharacterized protein n=1 Tax=Nephila pilipes TaxID=299642 RepID=A0A8X6PJN7_NEPPI|nr:hypothetical protein NPIL_623891 [Nephila pilipes]
MDPVFRKKNSGNFSPPSSFVGQIFFSAPDSPNRSSSPRHVSSGPSRARYRRQMATRAPRHERLLNKRRRPLAFQSREQDVSGR